MGWHRFGRYEVAAFETGRFRLDGGAMFGVIPKKLWEKSNPADDRNRIAMTMRTLLLRDDEHLLVVDAGVGQKDAQKFHEIYSIDFSECSIDRGFAELGISPAEVTGVFLTHLHFDHVGGAVYRDDGELRLTFPNATHFVQREQWEWGQQPSDRDRASYMPDNFNPIAEAGKLQMIDGPEELLPGVRAEVMQGHTFGQQLLRISEGDQSIVYAADLIPMSSHVPEPWIMGYDLQPLVTLREKQALLANAVSDRDILIYEHDPAVEASLVTRGDKGFHADQGGSLADVMDAAGRAGA